MLAFIFDSVGFGEWFILLAVVLIVVGPQKLPSTARKLGNYYAKLRRAADSFKRQLMDMDTEIGKAANEASSGVAQAFTPPPVEDGPESRGMYGDDLEFHGRYPVGDMDEDEDDGSTASSPGAVQEPAPAVEPAPATEPAPAPGPAHEPVSKPAAEPAPAPAPADKEA